MGKSFSKEQIEEALSVCNSKEEIYDYLHITENQLRYNLQKYHLHAPKKSSVKQEIGNKYMVDEDSWNTEEVVQEIQFRDQEKIKWCNQNQIPLLIIPYTINAKAQIQETIFQFLNNI